MAADPADVALHAQHHPRLQHAVGRVIGPVGRVRQGRVFVGEADAVVEYAVAGREAVGRRNGRPLGEVAEGDTRPKQRRVVRDLVRSDAEEVALFVRRPDIAAKPGARQVGAEAVRADEIGVEGDEIARLGLRAADRMEPLIERLGDNLDSIEEGLMTERKLDVRGKLAHLRRTLISFRRLIWPQRDVLNTLEIEDLSFFSARDRVRLREASQRSARLGDELQALSERAVLVHEQILDSRAEQMNRTMLLLTAVTVILMPLTVISGVLGMNVAGIPYADSPYAFWVVSGLLALIGSLLFFVMRRVKWL